MGKKTEHWTRRMFNTSHQHFVLYLPSLPQGFSLRIRWQVWILVISCTSPFVEITPFNPWHGLAGPRLAHTKQPDCSNLPSHCQQRSNDCEQTRGDWSWTGGAKLGQRQPSYQSEREILQIQLMMTCKDAVLGGQRQICLKQQQRLQLHWGGEKSYMHYSQISILPVTFLPDWLNWIISSLRLSY